MSKPWRHTLNTRRHAIAESDSSTDGCKETLLTKSFSNPESTKFCSNCCTCKVPNKQKSKSKQNLLTSRSDSKVEHKYPPYKEQLEMKVLNDEMNEQVSHEKHNSSKKLIEDLTALLRSVSIYVHCIDVRHKAADRLRSIISEVFPMMDCHIENKATTSWLSYSSKLCEIMRSCNENIELPENYYENLDDYKDKYKDYTKASSNFCQILETEVNMSNTQLNKLEMQYDEIRSNYSNSKTNVASQFNDIISKRSEVAESCVQALLPILNEVMDQDRITYNLLKGLSFEAIKYEKVSSSKSYEEKNYIGSRRKLDSEKSCMCSQFNRDCQ